MKKLVAIFILVSSVVGAAEIFDEIYIMEKAIPYLTKGATYSLNGEKVKAVKVTKAFLKDLNTNDNPIYFYDTNNKKSMAKIGDYLITSETFSDIYTVEEKTFEENYIKQ